MLHKHRTSLTEMADLLRASDAIGTRDSQIAQHILGAL